ncbi:MAG: prepilin-type N-terminal cleavage/methylation domain-containing protein [Candidatus Babeliaceae bacterium]|jgi:type IV pilus assembly protein PilA
MNKKTFLRGFSLIELMIVVSILAFLSMLVIPHLSHFLAKSKRTEAYINLRSLYMAQKAYWLEHGSYTQQLAGPDSLGWKPEGVVCYSYGFGGSEGVNNVIGSLKTPSSALAPATAGSDSFIIAAAGDIDGDGTPDVLTIDQSGIIKIVTDDLA